MLHDILYFVFGVIIGIAIGYVLFYNKISNSITCNECGFTTKNKSLRQCPKCGNPLK